MKGTGHIFRNSTRDGFTLIELIIVLFLIGVIAGIVGLYVGKDTASLKLKKFTREVSSVMRYARNHAVTEKKIYCLVIDKDERMLRLYSEDTDYTNVTLVMDKEIPEDLEIDIDMPTSDREGLYVEFFPLGSTTGGVVEISNVKGSSFFIIVNRITGKIILEKE